MRHFFIDPTELRKEFPLVRGSDARHLSQVLRLGAGDRIGLLDGSGRGYEAQIVGRSGNDVRVKIVTEYEVPRESPLEIVVAQALLKEKKMDRLIRQLTELGIAEWRPVVCERSIPRLGGDRLTARVTRWGKIAVEAMKQCRRGRVPDIYPPVPLVELLEADLSCDRKVVCWEEEARGSSLDGQPPMDQSDCYRRILLLLGPEGGFSQNEVSIAVARGFETAGLGPRILRAETATIAAVAMVQYQFGDMGGRGPVER